METLKQFINRARREKVREILDAETTVDAGRRVSDNIYAAFDDESSGRAFRPLKITMGPALTKSAKPDSGDGAVKLVSIRPRESDCGL